MRTFILLLRGINVGGNNILPMKELVFLLEGASCQNVKTYIQSGNVVFESEALPENFASLIETKFGFKPELLFFEKKEFLKLVEANPFSSPVGKEIHFYFCQQNPEPELDKINALKSVSESYSLIDTVFYLHAPDGIGRSKLVSKIEQCLGASATGRNLNTINKLMGMLA